MATLRSNPILNGFSGMLGNTVVFRNLRGKTVLSQRPAPPKKQSEQQKANRSKFREATEWAKDILKDPQRKEYYLKKAKKLNLPNAYTAAITDYMRSPLMDKYERNGTTIINVSKKDFTLKKVEVKLNRSGAKIKSMHIVFKNGSEDWMISLTPTQLEEGVLIEATDSGNRCWNWRL
jgi:hypothetical protein